nr:TonB family protein [Pseudomonadota bacterium]
AVVQAFFLRASAAFLFLALAVGWGAVLAVLARDEVPPEWPLWIVTASIVFVLAVAGAFLRRRRQVAAAVGGGARRAQRISGSISGEEDYFRAARRQGVRGTVGVRYTVGTDGRISNCRVTRSSGDPGLDATTCRLIEERFRYRPARDASGRAVPDTVSTSFDYDWVPRRRGGN